MELTNHPFPGSEGGTIIMTKIKDIISKPSQALKAMIDGLREQDARQDFKIDMGTYGWVDPGKVCYGCAATCAVQKVTGINLDIASISLENQAHRLGVEESDLDDFQTAIDTARSGSMAELFNYFGIFLDDMSQWDYRWCLLTDTWKEEIYFVEAVIAEMIEAGY